MTILQNEKLIKLIREEITRSGGYISFARYMELALYTPELGYYNTEKTILGKDGDFVTAPEISPLFSRCLAKQFQQILNAIPSGDILEIGAGSGKFAKEVLLELEKENCLPKEYLILEISPTLRERQLQLFQTECPQFLTKIRWIDALPEKIIGIIFANELLDALPVSCFHIGENGIEERCVTWQNNHFAWQLTKPTTPAIVEHINTILAEHPLPESYQSEINLSASRWVEKMANNLSEGVILLIDYGYGRNEYYHPDRSEGTLMCFYQHQKQPNPLILPGLQDITAHIDFTAIAEAANMSLAGFTTQSSFLLGCGLLELAAETTEIAAAYNQAQAIKTLTLPSQMGEIIKVIGFKKQIDLPLKGFSLHDRRRDL